MVRADAEEAPETQDRVGDAAAGSLLLLAALAAPIR
jgi:hypothetical protein